VGCTETHILNLNVRARLIVSVSVVAITCGVATAQTASAQAAPTSSTAAQPEPGQGVQEAASSSALGDIVVTARRREELLQRVPVSITSLSGTDISARSAHNMAELAAFIPNVVAAGGGTGPSFGTYAIRGVGTVRSAVEDEPPVALYIDGVYQGYSDGALLQLIEPKRIEVLRGPQGTLFGKNALGGAVQYITQEPLDKFDGQLKLTYGSYNRVSVTGYVDLPVSDALLTRVTAGVITRDGTVKSLASGQDVNNINTRFLGGDILWRPSTSFSLRVSGDYTNYDTRGDGNVIFAVDTADANVRRYSAIGIDLSKYVTGDPYTNYATRATFVRQKVGGVAVTGTLSIAKWLDIKSITSYRENSQRNSIDRDGTPYAYFEQSEVRHHWQFSEELQLIGNLPRFKWIIGGYYFKVEPRSARTRFEGVDVPGTLPINESVRIRSNSKAIFGEGTYTLSDVFSLTVGGRYTSEFKDTYAATDNGRPTSPLVVGENSGNFTNFSPRVVVQAQWAPTFMTYASWSKGFRSGGFNTRYNAALPNNGFAPYDPETMTNYEIGTRADLVDRHLRLNLTYFHALYNNLQLTATFPGTTTTFTQNVGAAKLDGVEFEGAAALTRAFRINFGAGYLDARYTDIGTAQGITLKSELARAPKWSYTIGGQYDFRMGGDSTLSLRGDYGYKSHQQEASTDAATVLQPGYGLLNGRLTYTTGSGKVSVAVYGTNLTKARYLVVGNIQRGLALAAYGEPREFGVTLTTKF
jgi:iron complex outermembrane receptor protein